MVGDRIATDMWGAKRAKIPHRILVQPYSQHIHGHNTYFIQSLLRTLERIMTGYYFYLLKNHLRSRKK
jgi:predicted HAD superfamily phosphohydrolase YqeG